MGLNGLSSLQVCMDSSDWLQGTIPDDTGLDSSSPSGGTDPMLACSRPLMERRLRPQHDQALKCPRCDSNHTKFCYYNNYSLSQPRYFCKTCRRYWTKGGTLRNIPVGGGCRKNKKVSSGSKKSTANNNNNNSNSSGNSNNENNIHHHHQPHLISPSPLGSALIMNSTDLQLSYPESSMQFSGSNLFGIGTSTNNPSFLFENLTGSANRAIDFMDGSGKFEGAGHFMGMMGSGGYGPDMGGGHGMGGTYHGTNLCSPFGGMTLDGITSTGINGFMDRGMIGYDHEVNNVNHEDHENMINGIDVKPKLLALEWQDQTGCSSDHHGAGVGKSDSFGYVTGLGSSWSGLMNGYGASTTNPLV